MPLTTMVAGSTARAADVNANFALCVLTDTSRTITVTHTYSASQTFTGGWTAAAACTITASSADSLDVGPNGATNPTLQVDASTASAATGLKVKSAAAAGGVALSVISSGTNENLTIDAKGSGTVTIGGTSTGSVVISRALTYGGVALSNSVTGTGSMVLSASPTFTGTVTAAAVSITGNTSLAGTITSSIQQNSKSATSASVLHSGCFTIADDAVASFAVTAETSGLLFTVITRDGAANRGGHAHVFRTGSGITAGFNTDGFGASSGGATSGGTATPTGTTGGDTTLNIFVPSGAVYYENRLGATVKVSWWLLTTP